eukprot:1142862-Pelagomonas_calceolata.AAC.4
MHLLWGHLDGDCQGANIPSLATRQSNELVILPKWPCLLLTRTNAHSHVYLEAQEVLEMIDYSMGGPLWPIRVSVQHRKYETLGHPMELSKLALPGIDCSPHACCEESIRYPMRCFSSCNLSMEMYTF